MVSFARWAILLIVIAAVVGGGLYWRHKRDLENSQDWQTLPRAQARRGDLTVGITEVGVIDVREKALIRAPFSGDINQIAEHGAWVEQGQPVIWLSTERIEEEYLEDVADLMREQAIVKQVSTQLERVLGNQELDMQKEVANLFFQRLRLEDTVQKLTINEALGEEKIVAERDVDASRLRAAGSSNQALQRDYDFQSTIQDQDAERKSGIRRMRQYVKRSEKSFDRAKRSADRVTSAVLTAPRSGIFQLEYTYSRSTYRAVPLKVGEHIHEGQDLASIPNTDTMMVRSQIPEADIRRLPVGTSATLRIDAVPTVNFRGRIVSVGRAAIERDASPGGSILASADLEHEKVFEVEVHFQPLHRQLRPGMSVNIQFEMERKPGVLIAPIEAIFHRGGNTVVYRDLGAQAEAVPVVTGLHSDTEVEIVSGLSDGDTLLLVDPASIVNDHQTG